MVKEYSDLLVIEANRYRQKTSQEILNETRALRKIEEEKAKERQGARTDIQENFPGSWGQARDKVAEQVGMSGKQLEKLEFIERERPELLKKIDKKEITIHSAYLQVKRDKKLKEFQDSNLILSREGRNPVRGGGIP